MLEVKPLLKSKGYGFHSDRKYPLWLNKPSADPAKRSKTTGHPYMEQLRPISEGELSAILTKAENAEHAALLIEQVSLGEVMSAVEEVRSSNVSDGLTADQIARIIDNRIGMRMSEELVQGKRELADMRADMAGMLDAMRELLDNAASAAPKEKKKATKKALKRTDAEVEEIVKGMNLPPIAPPTE